MPKLTDDGELDYDEKRKNENSQYEHELELARLQADTEIRKARIAQRGVIIAALIALFGALFPSNPPSEPYRPLIIALGLAITGQDFVPRENETPDPTLVVTFVPTQLSPTNIADPTLMPFSTSTPFVPATPFCAFLSSDQVAFLQQIQNTASAIRQAEEFAGYRQNDYQVGDLIPSNVVIATNVYSTDFDRLGLTPINNSNGYGLFLTVRELIATYPGTYWCINGTVTPLTTTIAPTIQVNRTTASDLDQIFGSGNWFCFPHQFDLIAYRDSRSPITVTSPIEYIEYWGARYGANETVNGSGGGTVNLLFPIDRADCPTSQQSALSAWTSSRQEITGQLIDQRLGVGNWTCSGPTSIVITRRVANLTVQYPFNSFDMNNVKYGVGDTIPTASSGTLWGEFGAICG